VSFADLIAKKSGAGDEWSESPEAGLSKAGSLEQFIQRHAHVTEEYSFYNGEVTLRFDKDEHKYYRVEELGNLVPVNGVTTVCGIVDKSFMLVPWASKMCAQKMLRLMPTELIEGTIRVKPLSLEEFTVLVMEAKSSHKDKLEDAADVGHMAHSWLEEWIKAGLSGKIEEQETMLKSLGTTWQTL
jgi:hypothetical protein